MKRRPPGEVMIVVSEPTRAPCSMREVLGDHAAERRADDVRAIEAEDVEQADRIARHVGEVVRDVERQLREALRAASAAAAARAASRWVDWPTSRWSKRMTWNPAVTSRSQK